MLSFQVSVLGSLFVSFRPSSLHSHSCSTSAYLVLSLSAFPLPIRFLSSTFLPVPATQPFCSSFPFLPVSASQWLLRCSASALASSALPRSSQPGFPCFRSRFFVLGFLFVSFHPSRFRSHSRSTGASLMLSLSGFSAYFLLSFVCFCSLLTTQPSALSFPCFPCSPGSGSHGALRLLASPLLSSSVRPVAMPSVRFRYSASCVSFLRFAVSCHRHYAAPGLLFPARPSP